MKKTFSYFAIAIVLAWLLSFAARGQSSIVVNGSFEDGLMPGTTNIMMPVGWGWGPTGAIRFTRVPGAADGAAFAEPQGFAYQDLVTAPGQAYHLSFAVAGRWTDSMSVTILWGDADIGSVSSANAGQIPPAWTYGNIDVLASSDQTRLAFQSSDPSFWLDAVQVTPIPEPKIMAFLALSLLVGMTMRKGKQGSKRLLSRLCHGSRRTKLAALPLHQMGASKLILILLMCSMAAHAQLAITVSPPKVMGQKAVVPLAMKNGLSQTVESARAVVFLLDEQGRAQCPPVTRWVISGGMAPGATNAFHFVISGEKPFGTTNLTAKVDFSRVVLEGGRMADVKKDVQIQSAGR